MKKFLIKVNGNQYEVEVEEVREDGAAVQSPAGTTSAQPAVMAQNINEVKRDTAVPAGASTVTAPMPGTILNVNVKTGDKVKKGQVLLVLEAMKMENEIVAPADGNITSVNVAKGSAVNAGDVLVSMA